jgi:preprotein translocase subunit SecE
VPVCKDELSFIQKKVKVNYFSHQKKIKKMNKVSTYIKEAYHELMHNVTWTAMPELQTFTTIVLVSLLLMTVLILGMDKISELIMITGIYENI